MKPVVYIICDGLGHSESSYGNAVMAADTPNLDEFKKNFPNTILKCCGKDVGLPPGTMGNSEVGHIHIGCGKLIFQPLQMINNCIEDDSFFKNEILLRAINHTKRNNSDLHIMGLFSEKGVHSTCEHLFTLLDMCKREKVTRVFIHNFLDGRDVPEKSAKKYLEWLKKSQQKHGVGVVASQVGRYYAMDRDLNWKRTKKAYDLLTKGVGVATETDTFKAIDNAYERGDKTDYYIKPIVMVTDEKQPRGVIKDNDSVIFYNYRSDRARQITRALTEDDFKGFEREKLKNLYFACMSEYDKNYGLPVAYPQKVVKENLGMILSKHGKKQLRIAETEKYAHVTFFFNSQVEEPQEGEDRIMVLSPKVDSYDQKPEMSAFEVTDKLVAAIESEKYDVVICNFANCDLVGHSGVFKAAKKATEVVDLCVGRVVRSTLRKYEKGVVMISADHGNSDEMLYPNGEINPAHSLNPVPFILVSNDEKLKNVKLKEGKGLIDVTPTILHCLGLEVPGDMDGESLIVE